jgi:hypothetical protein
LRRRVRVAFTNKLTEKSQNQRTHKRIRGSQRDNKNAKKAPPWISYPLDLRENLDRFITDMIKATWTGRLGTRQASTINAATKLLLDFRGWIPRQQQPPPDPNQFPPFTFKGVKIETAADAEEMIRKGGEEFMQKRMMELAQEHLSKEDQETLKRALARDPKLQGEVSEWPAVRKARALVEKLSIDEMIP